MSSEKSNARFIRILEDSLEEKHPLGDAYDMIELHTQLRFGSKRGTSVHVADAASRTSAGRPARSWIFSRRQPDSSQDPFPVLDRKPESDCPGRVRVFSSPATKNVRVADHIHNSTALSCIPTNNSILNPEKVILILKASSDVPVGASGSASGLNLWLKRWPGDHWLGPWPGRVR